MDGSNRLNVDGSKKTFSKEIKLDGPKEMKMEGPNVIKVGVHFLVDPLLNSTFRHVSPSTLPLSRPVSP